MATKELFQEAAERLKEADEQIADAEEVIAFQKDAGIPTSDAVSKLNELRRKKSQLESALRKRNFLK